MMKRIFDFGLAVAGLPVLILLLPFVTILILIDSPGPVFFSQQRVGLKRRLFRLYKFRTMQWGTVNLPSHVAGTQSITPVGRWLRRTKLDEIPQILNVLLGEMSFVGPRPCLPSQTELIEKRLALGVFDIRPGITGVAQIQGLDMSDPALLARKDAEYSKNMSLFQDFIILWATAVGKGKGDAARRHS